MRTTIAAPWVVMVVVMMALCLCTDVCSAAKIDVSKLLLSDDELRADAMRMKGHQQQRGSFAADGADPGNAPLPIQRLEDNTVCVYPCILQNGCVCNHTQTWMDFDLQIYGVCVACSPGWTGYDCGTVSQKCLNGGQLAVNSVGGVYCNCTEAWEGRECGDQRCLHAVNGTGPLSINDNKVNNSCPECLPGWNGLSCDMCTLDSQCTGENAKCDTTPVAHSTNKKLFCNLTDESWLGLFSNYRPGVQGRIVVDWVNTESWTTAQGSGTGYMSIWRVEPDNVWLDPFFYCSTKSCTMTVTSQKTTAVVEPMPPIAGRVRWGLSGVMYAGCFIIILNGVIGWFVNVPAKARTIVFQIASAMVVSTLVAFILFSCLFGHREKVPPKVETLVTYECEHSACTCAEDPPLRVYWPFCKDSTFQQYFLPILTGKSKTVCDIDTGTCYFAHENLAWQKINLQCTASECVTHNSTVDAHNVTVDKSDAAAVTSGGIVGGAIVLLAIHYVVMMQLSRHNVVEFRAKYEGAAGRGTKENGVNDDDGPRPTVDSPLRGPMPTDGKPSFGGSAREPLIADDRNVQSYGGGGGAGSSGGGGKATTTNNNISFCSEDDDVEDTTTWVTLDNACYFVGGKQVLHNVHMTVKSGEMIAIMGPSGSGKTTLLDVLTRREKSGTTRGEMYINGHLLGSDSTSTWAYKRMIGYVAQEENLIAALTVRQTIRFAARLKLPVAIPDSVIDDLVEDTIDKMHLRSCADTLVGNEMQRGISGGEKRRVSIATELVANPRILYLDEPTSGLDSQCAHDVMRAIGNLRRRTSVGGGWYRKYFAFRPAVVFSIHQPSSDIFALFDRVMLLSRGHVLYLGPAKQAVAHVCSVAEGMVVDAGTGRNPAELLLSLQHEATPEQFAALAASPSPAEQLAHDATSPLHDMTTAASVIRETIEKQKFYPNVWQQFALLSRRSWAALMGSYYLIMSHAAAVIFLGLTMSFLYEGTGLDLFGVEDKAGMVTFFLLLTSFSSLSCLDLFIGEKKLFAVERENGYYNTLPYFATKVLFDFVPLRIVPTMILSSVIYFPMGLRTDGGAYFLWFVACSTLFSLFVTSLCFIIAILCPTFGSAALFSSLMILWNTAFGGLMIQSRSIPKAFIPFKYASPFYYAYEAIMVNILDGLQCVFDPDNSEGQSEGVHVPIPCRQALSNLGLDPTKFRRDMIALIAGPAVTLVVGFSLLWLLRRNTLTFLVSVVTSLFAR